MRLTRSSGILLHPTSLPGTPGIGTVGKQARDFVDWLVDAGQSLWQILPLGPTGYGDSPYASFSTFAGNPLLIDLDELHAQGLLTDAELCVPEWISREGPVDFGSVVWWKIPLLRTAAARFLEKTSENAAPRAAFSAFMKEEAYWLNDYALFRDIKAHFDAIAQERGTSSGTWNTFWPKDLASRKPKALRQWSREHASSIAEEKAIQFFFFSQWTALKRYANERGISIIGDIPIFVAADSADVWANQRLFQLNKDGAPLRVAGVPPDYFSETGQLWGNPLYDWKVMKKTRFAWWKRRIEATLRLVDYVRIDHFRGFEAYWSVPAGEPNAIKGEWVPGPDHAFFKEIKKSLGDLPILAEDLGVITDRVRSLRDDFDLPGMRVLQFAFSSNEVRDNGFVNSFLPHMYVPRTVVYTGTHDNDTLAGWLASADAADIAVITDYLGLCKGDDIASALIRSAFMSVAQFAMLPLQDVYGIGSEGRMNAPSTVGGNWSWRMDEGHLSPEKARWLSTLSALSARNMRGTP